MRYPCASQSNDAGQTISVSLYIVLLVLIVGIMLTASVPPVSRDALTHHLALPKLYLERGGLVELPEIPFSYYPMNLDLLYVAALSLGNDILPKYIHFLFGLFTAWLIYRYLRMRIDRIAGLIGALLWLSLPIVVRLSSEVYVDLGLGFFSMAALYSLIRWSESEKQHHHLILAGVWSGLALGTKYNALLILAVLMAVIPFIYLRLKPRQTMKSDGGKSQRDESPGRAMRNFTYRSNLRALLCSLLFAGVALAVFSPWGIRNVILKGNPVYPMLTHFFNSGDSHPQDEWSRTSSMVQNTSNTLVVRRLVFKESFGYIALIPLRIFFEGRDDDPRYFDGKLNPVLPLFVLAALVLLRANPGRLATERWIWLAYAVLFMIMAFFLAPIRIRYLVPILPSLVVLVVIGIYNLKALAQRILHPVFRYAGIIALTASVLAMFLFNAFYFVERFHKLEPLAFLSGKISRDAYIAKRRPEYPLIQYINTNAAKNARILAIFLGGRRYYFDRDVIFNEGILLKAVSAARTPDDIDTILKESGITDIMVRTDLFQQWLINTLTQDEIERFKIFWKMHVHKIAGENGFVLYGLR